MSRLFTRGYVRYLDLAEPVMYETFSVENTSSDALWSMFNLGPAFSTKRGFSLGGLPEEFCPFKFKYSLWL